MTNPAEKHNLNQEQVLSFLKENPDWLDSQTEILETLSPKSESGTISLAGRQLDNLRTENRQLKSDIQSYLANARENEQLLNTTFDFCLELLLCATPEELRSYMQERCQTLFQLPEMRLYIKSGDAQNWQTERRALHDALGDNMPSTEIVTGRLVSSAKQYLFGEAENVASVALIPLGDDCAAGLLVLASHDEQHFDPQKGDLFLQLIAKSLLSWCQQRGD
ncbi:MAG: DUF484 family protein [Enterobacterales bacterium]|nr:DUF484 family protein [Enterobacterales bacterium]